MSDQMISTSGYFVLDDDNTTTADNEESDEFMSEAKSYTMYKIGE